MDKMNKIEFLSDIKVPNIEVNGNLSVHEITFEEGSINIPKAIESIDETGWITYKDFAIKSENDLTLRFFDGYGGGYIPFLSAGSSNNDSGVNSISTQMTTTLGAGKEEIIKNINYFGGLESNSFVTNIKGSIIEIKPCFCHNWSPDDGENAVLESTNPAIQIIASGDYDSGIAYNNIKIYGSLLYNDKEVITKGDDITTSLIKIGDYYLTEAILEQLSPKITFTIDGITYTAQQDMTWREWIATTYNIGNYYYYDGYVVRLEGGIERYCISSSTGADDEKVLATSKIISGGSYTHTLYS